ncbi:uncharacterized protein LOC128550172 [Mercenaria mercenaria]|uniref:uncharacterized protein LOC128550172 n=1 Tax=Mercenaria mercenaria TaxID=6596 RepID=UPI00234E620D|nr:uncharacterized protein LOC128550172 [Mercenaria mercenaria]
MKLLLFLPKMEFTKRNLILTLIVLNVWEISSRATSDQVKPADTELENEELIQLHVITKREAGSDIQQDYPHVDGRTFPASEPLDPNGAGTLNDAAPQSLFQGFETENEVFQPELDAGTSDEGDTTTGSDVGQHTGNNEGNDTVDSTRTAYGAQYPYTETTERSQYPRSVSHTGTRSQGYQTNDGVQQTVTSRRIVLTGRGSDTSENSHSGTHTRTE